MSMLLSCEATVLLIKQSKLEFGTIQTWWTKPKTTTEIGAESWFDYASRCVSQERALALMSHIFTQFMFTMLKYEEINTRQMEARQGGGNTDKSITRTNFPSHSQHWTPELQQVRDRMTICENLLSLCQVNAVGSLHACTAASTQANSGYSNKPAVLLIHTLFRSPHLTLACYYSSINSFPGCTL